MIRGNARPGTVAPPPIYRLRSDPNARRRIDRDREWHIAQHAARVRREQIEAGLDPDDWSDEPQ